MVKVKNDLTGTKRGRLTVIRQAEDYVTPSGRHKPQWYCLCDCGVYCTVRLDGNTQSCGCLHVDMARALGESMIKDLTGMRFGRLKVVKRVENKLSYNGNKSYVMYECICDCGNTCVVRAECLVNGTTKSCGCLNRELTSERCKARMGTTIGNYKVNTYEFYDDYIVGYDEQGNKFYCDLEDYEKIKPYYWSKNSAGYIVSVNNNLYMHAFVTDCPDELVPDHINGNTSRNDNRKSNLRIVTNQQNTFNKDKGKNNTSGFVGVQFKKGIYIASIGYDYKTIILKRTNDFTEAVKFRILGEIEYFGEHMYKPHLKVLDYINQGGKLQYRDSDSIDKIMYETK